MEISRLSEHPSTFTIGIEILANKIDRKTTAIADKIDWKTKTIADKIDDLEKRIRSIEDSVRTIELAVEVAKSAMFTTLVLMPFFVFFLSIVLRLSRP